jgi:HK97 gp10 family phage protein
MEDVQGLQGLLSKLGDLESLVAQKRIVARAVRSGCVPIQERAQELAPDDPTTAGSQIKENITSAVTEQTATSAIGKIGPSRKGFVGQFAEYGTAHQSAEPFMRPAWDEKIGEALQIMGETLAEEIKTAVR